MKKRLRKRTFILVLVFIYLVVSISLFISGYIIVNKSVPVIIYKDVGEELDEDIPVKTVLYDTKLEKKVANVSLNKVGKYNAIYSFRYMFFNTERVIQFVVQDNIAPTFTSFTDKVQLYVNDQYVKKADYYTVADNYDKEEDIKVSCEGKIDTSTAGDYYMRYKATDTSGNTAEEVQKVTVEKISPINLSIKDFRLKDYFSDIILKETPDMGEEYMNNVYLVGDSVFWNFANYGIYSKNRTWAKPCTDPNNVFNQKVDALGKTSGYTILELLERVKPKYIVLSIGGCQCQHNKPEEAIEQYKKFLDYLKEKYPEMKIMIMPLPPVDETRCEKNKNNSSRNKFNYYVGLMCREYNIPLLDVTEILRDTNGQAKSGLYMSDGYHPNSKGMKMIIDYIRKHGYI